MLMNQPQESQESTQKISYHAPQITDYGTLQENTQQGSLCVQTQ
jgi:hypothetical protein